MPPTGQWTPKWLTRRALLFALTPVVCALVYLASEAALPDHLPPLRQSHNVRKFLHADYSMDSVIQSLYKPLLHPVDARNFTDDDGHVWKLPGPPRFTKYLGKDVLILDIDSRPFVAEGQIMNENLTHQNLKYQAAGMLGHYMYAKIHGYDYKFVRAPNYPDRHGTWVKVPLMKEALKTYKYIVFMDSDAQFHHLRLPLEWLLNYWQMTDKTLTMMAIDPDKPENRDRLGKVYYNTGFVVAQAGPRTQDLFARWVDCPLEARYEGCAHWRRDWPHEQAAFGEYVRYDFDPDTEVRSLPCAEANGAPQAISYGCRGVFVRHYWVDKPYLKPQLTEHVMQLFVSRLHQAYLDTHGASVIDNRAFRFGDAGELIPPESGELVSDPFNGTEAPKDGHRA